MTDQPNLVEYSSEAETRKHIMRVSQLLGEFACEMIRRGAVHDASKLGPEEKPYFDRETPKLNQLTYGTDEYKASLKALKPAIEHHYRENSHHPEFYQEEVMGSHENGINGMDLFDLVEMFFDWKAASERGKDGDLLKGLEINKERFGVSDQLHEIFCNTADRLITWPKYGGFYRGEAI